LPPKGIGDRVILLPSLSGGKLERHRAMTETNQILERGFDAFMRLLRYGRSESPPILQLYKNQIQIGYLVRLNKVWQKVVDKTDDHLLTERDQKILFSRPPGPDFRFKQPMDMTGVFAMLVALIGLVVALVALWN
jgi:hypothetical protein